MVQRIVNILDALFSRPCVKSVDNSLNLTVFWAKKSTEVEQVEANENFKPFFLFHALHAHFPLEAFPVQSR